jgi:hypothetical protein
MNLLNLSEGNPVALSQKQRESQVSKMPPSQEAAHTGTVRDRRKRSKLEVAEPPIITHAFLLRDSFKKSDLIPLDDLDYCAECGQVGCCHDGRDRSGE